MPAGNSIYLDEVTPHATYSLLRAGNVTNVTVLEAITSRQEALRWLLGKRGIEVAEASFFAGHLRTPEGEAVYLAARRLSAKFAQVAAGEIVNSDRLLHGLNEFYKRNTIRLFVAKRLRPHLEYAIKRLLVVQALSKTGRSVFWLKEPVLIDGALLREVAPDIDLQFYRNAGFGSIALIKAWLLNVLRDVKLTTRGLGQHAKYLDSTVPLKPSLLTLQEDCVRADRGLRGQPHWLDPGDPPTMFDTYVVKLEGSSFSVADDASELAQSGVRIIPTGAFRLSARTMRRNKTILRVRRDRRAAIWGAVRASGRSKRYFLLQASFLLRQAELMGALALQLNARVFLIRETYYSLADALLLVAPDLNITTIAYQYSNMGFVSTGMMSTADKYLIFSQMYQALFQTDDISPVAFLSTGYLYDGVASIVREKAAQHREMLMRFGARFIVCYLDESVQDDRWGLVSIEDHLGELHALARAVLADPELGLVVKSQFSR